MNPILIITKEQARLRLDQVVSQSWEDMSRSRAAALISGGSIRVNDGTKRPGYKVQPGDRVEVDDVQEVLVPEPEKMDLSILHEDDHILVVDKPAGQVVHPAPGHLSGTLVNGLLAHDPVFGNPYWEPMRPGIVHRLDKDTSGLILLAKTLKSLEFLQKEFKQRRVEKDYLALVQGENIPETGEIELPVGRHPKNRKLMTVLEAGGKYARTGFRVRERFTGGALMEVRLHTGRTHQIRVHFYHQGMPLFGDRVYQARRHRKGGALAPRQMLHSWKLSFRHPYSGLKMDFQTPAPEDFTQTMNQLNLAG